MTHDVFISYSNKDKYVADGICVNLEAAGIRCWIAPRDIDPGEDWPTAIALAIKQSSIMVLVFSVNSNTSEEVGRELILAANNKLIIIPFRIENVEPEPGKQYYLARTHWLDAINPPTKEQIYALLNCVHALLPDNVLPKDHEVQLITPPSIEKTGRVIDPTELKSDIFFNIPKKQDTYFNQVIIFDAFNDNSNDWSVGDIDGDWWVGTRLIENGVLDWKGMSRRAMFSHQSPRKANLQENYTDMEVSSWVKLIDPRTDGSFGITLRGIDVSNHKFQFYAFLINQDKYHAFLMYTDSKWKTLVDWKINPYLQIHDWNRLTAQAIGSHFRLMINDNLVSEIDNAALHIGKGGVIINMNRGAEKIQFQFDDFEVRLPSSSH